MATQQTAETNYVVADGIKMAYRRLGRTSGIPLVMHMHFRGNMDFWDPALVNALAQSRSIILFDSTGVGKSEGEIPTTFQGWAANVIALLKALEVPKIDLLGFSMGGMAVQFVYLQAPGLVRKLILAGTCTSGNPSFVKGDFDFYFGLANPISEGDFYTGWARSFFYNTPHGQEVAKASWQRIFSRTQDRAPQLRPELAKRQAQARVAFRKPHPDNPFERIAEFKIPVFVANGDNDLLIPTQNSVELARILPHAHLHIYPNSGHGFLFQYAELFAKHVDLFLNGDDGGLEGKTEKVMASCPNFGTNYTGFQNLTQQQLEDTGTYHVINGTVAYSTLLRDRSTFRTLQGNSVTITVLNGSTYVNDAKLIHSDLLVSNSVMQVLDSLLNYNETSARLSLPSQLSSTSNLGLSIGAKAGIAIAGIFLVRVLLAAAHWVYRHRRSNARWREAASPKASLSRYDQIERSGDMNALHDEPGVGLDELPGSTRLATEMEAEERAVELKLRGVRRAELP